MSLLKESEIKVHIQSVPQYCLDIVPQELKEAYFTELSASKAATATAGSSKESKPGKSKPLVKKKVIEDPFASDDEADLQSGKLVNVGGKRKVQEGESEGSGSKSPVRKKKNM